MKKIVLFAVAAMLAVSCNNAPTARINVTLEGAADTSVVLQKLNFNRLQPVDTIKTDASGKFSYKVKLEGNAPYFYYLYYGENPVAALVLLPKDKVTLDINAKGGYVVEGSEESELLRQANESFAKSVASMDRVLASMPENPDEAQMKEINKELSAIYVNHKKDALRHVITNPYSISSAVVLFEKFNDNLRVFDELNDAVIFKRTLDSLTTVYPYSDYVVALRDEVDLRGNQMEMYGRLNNAPQISFPDLSLPDVDGQTRKLSELEGKVIILSFWSVGQTEYKMFNNELKSLYEKYNASGLEIYQVGLDVDKPSWASVVKDQKMPFVNVNDGYGIQSPAVISYNVSHIPAMFVISRDGNIVATDVFDEAKLEEVVRRLL